MIPSSIYHLLIHENFTLFDAIDFLPYLERLGIDGIYTSSLFEALSPHAYDIVNTHKINPKIGGFEAFDRLCEALHAREMKLVVDVIPNHMGIKGKNPWWWQLLKEGPNSPYAPFFDIEWNPSKKSLTNKVLLPILATTYGEALDKGEIQLKSIEGEWVIQYKDWTFPLSSDTPVTEEVQKEALHTLLEKQFYRLAHYELAGQEINYRRFFNINELIAIHIENKQVLEEHHRFLFSLVEGGKVQGVRIDHADGLYDPQQYLERVRTHKPGFIVVEKILDYNETLPSNWPVDGTVGYEFLAMLNGLFVHKKNEGHFTRIYERFIGYKMDFEKLLYERKLAFIDEQMGSELHQLGERLERMAEMHLHYRDFARVNLTQALKGIIASFPVYRTYIRPEEEITKRDRDYIVMAVEKAKSRNREISYPIYEFIQALLLKEIDLAGSVDFIMRFQQMTAPVTAKSLEDSCFYIYNRLLSLNEVGSSPEHFGVAKSEFHQFNIDKLKKWPLGFLPTATHDSKWSQDARMRLNVLSQMPKKWGEVVFKWEKEMRKHKTKIETKFGKELFPDRNTEFYLYQMLLAGYEGDVQRVEQAFLKAMREAGLYTSWIHPKEKVEKAGLDFLHALLRPDANNSFYPSFIEFQKEIDRLGKESSLSSFLLQVGSPGILDLYQGNEVWNFALMDPDNRRSVQKEVLEKGDEKSHLIQKALHFRRAHPELFLKGEYIPLKVNKEECIAFLRQREEKCALICVMRFIGKPPETLALPKNFPLRELTDLFTGQKIPIQKNGKELTLNLLDLFDKAPYAFLTH